MSDYIKGVTVTFDHDIHEEDAARIVDAIKMLRGVASVVASTADVDDQMARERVSFEWRQKVICLLKSAS